LVSCALALVAGAGAAAAEKRVALVIGNAAYDYTAALPNPRNDAEDISAQLKGLGFQVITGLDLDKAGMDAKITEFAQALNGADVGVFFYGGHALQFKGQNYIVPTDAKLMTAPSLEFEMVRLESVQQVMEGEAKTNIIFLDACRDNPLARNLARALKTRGTDFPRGLAPVESGIGTLISFSTQPGSVAYDGEGRNSPFAAALVKHIGAEQPVTDVLIAVRNDVVDATQQQQVPWEHSALRSKFYFKEPAAGRVAAAPAAVPAPAPTVRPAGTADPTYELQAELALWKSIKDSKNPALLQSFVDQFPNGRFAKTAQLMNADLKEEKTQLGVAEKRDSDAAAAAADQRQALAQAEEARRKADDAKLSSDYRTALEEARKAREAAEEAGRRQAEAEKAAEEARKRAEASGARQETAASAPMAVASLQDEAGTTARTNAGPAMRSIAPDPAVLALDIQKQLKRVGCYNSSVDGKWGDGSRAALEKFADATHRELNTEEPSEEALAALDESKPGVCTQAATSGGGERKSTQPTSRRQTRGGGSRRQRGPTGTVIFGVGKGVGIGIGF
jgi:uncharacterized caspase-like protein